MKESPRRRARELVLQAIYASDCALPASKQGEISPEEAFAKVIEDKKLSDKNLRFVHTLFALVRENSTWADKQIGRLAEHWDIERIAAIDRVILRMALVELVHVPDTPVKVVLNEAIELARKFSTSSRRRL